MKDETVTSLLVATYCYYITYIRNASSNQGEQFGAHWNRWYPDNAVKIDLHTHILPEAWPDLSKRYGYGGFVQLEHSGPGCARMVIDGKSFREVHDTCWDPKRRLADCEEHGVHVQVL